MKIFLLGFACLVAACGQPDYCGSDMEDGIETEPNQMCAERLTRELRISSKFNVEQRSEMHAAMVAWNRATDGKVNLTFVIVGENANVNLVDNDSIDYYATAHPATGDINIQSELDLVYYYPTFAHELGHTFGLKHSESKFALMTEGPTSLDIIDEDIGRFNALYNKGLR